MAEQQHVESAAAPEPALASAPTGLAGSVIGAAGLAGVVEYLAAAADDTRAECVRGLQGTIGNRQVSRLVLARATPSSLIPEGDPHLSTTRDPEVLRLAAQERERIGVADQDFNRNVAVIKFERDGKVGYIAKGNVPDLLHSEEVLIGELHKKDPGLTKTKILEVFSEREPCSSKCKPLLARLRAEKKYDFLIHHWVPEKGTLGERADLLRGKYKKEGLLTNLAPKKTTKKQPLAEPKQKAVPKGKGIKPPGPLKGPVINFGVGIGTALLTSLIHDAILNSVQAMPRPTLEAVDIYSRDGMAKAGPMDLAGADLKLEVEAFESGRGALTVDVIKFWHELDKTPPAGRDELITAAEDAIWSDQGMLVEAQRNVSLALTFKEQITEGVTAAAELHAMLSHPLVMQYVMGLGLSFQEVLKIRDNLAWYQAVFTRGVLEPLDRLSVRIDAAIDANESVLAQLKARRALERSRSPRAAPPPPAEPSEPRLIPVEPLR